MDTTMESKKNTRPAFSSEMAEYGEHVRKLIYDELKNALDEEMQKAAQELLEEQRKAIRQVLEENKAAIRQVVEEEKKNIWDKADSLRQSILKFGL